MKRRTFVGLTGAAVAAVAGRGALAQTAAAAPADPAQTATLPEATRRWRTFELRTDVRLPADAGASKLWLPLPNPQDTAYQRELGVAWEGNASHVEVRRDPVYGAPALYAQWDASVKSPALTTRAWAATRDRWVDLRASDGPYKLAPEERLRWLAATPHIPTDGIVRDTALKAITEAPRDPVAQARALFDWIIANTYRNPKTVGCGTGDIRFMLESGDLGGKCADLNPLFVGMARSIGIPARDVYGVRVADSKFWKSLGKSGDITRAQHCRAEFHDPRFGWVPVDPADVRKIILEEAPGTLLPMDDPRVEMARRKLFGFWEMNWVGYNNANDLTLSPPAARPLNFFMYPRAETASGPLDPYDPAAFQYSMNAREIVG
ncbi:transglutaminase-like domain-containing protein [Chitinasiproducens palmae]|uniref:Transglutaminase-like enzyme, putative cysteine protease n=1 Tax=Chitinasiproducens palmae TaxID=1770053 RepID=A0A1H2PVY9_9BURK|nr:transglutaminase family protein [Chitinasiproducens palmae]SDV51499.1 Transglutaminase-like enzyme, putative cysteine protease [Chitinasiproducens palmae]